MVDYNYYANAGNFMGRSCGKQQYGPSPEIARLFQQPEMITINAETYRLVCKIARELIEIRKVTRQTDPNSMYLHGTALTELFDMIDQLEGK